MAAAAPDHTRLIGAAGTAPVAGPGAIPGLGSAIAGAAERGDTGVAVGAAGVPVIHEAAADQLLQQERNC